MGVSNLNPSREVPDLVVRGDEDLDDAGLVAQTRAGNREAFGVLWRRHAKMAGGVARSFTNSVDPDDLVAESFARVYLAISNGGGPNDAFRPYLLTTLRNTARTWGRRSHESATDSIEEYIEEVDPDPILMGLANRELIQRTFASLPTRWQEALWWSEVEGRSASEIAELTGLSDNAAAALCYRAREGLRQAWIQTQVPAESANPECRWTLTRIGAFVRSGLSANHAERVQGHLDDCSRCARIGASAARIGRTLGIALVGAGSSGVALATALSATAGAGAMAPTGFAKLKNLTTSNPTVGIAAALVLVLLLAVPATAASGVWRGSSSEAAAAAAAVIPPAVEPPAKVSVPPPPDKTDPAPPVSSEPHPDPTPAVPTASPTPTAGSSSASERKSDGEKPKPEPKVSPTPSATPPAVVPTSTAPTAAVPPTPPASPSVPTEPVVTPSPEIELEPSPTPSEPSPPSESPSPSPTEPTVPPTEPTPSPTEPSPSPTEPGGTTEPDPELDPGGGGGGQCERPGHHQWGCGGWGDHDRDQPDEPKPPQVPDPPLVKEPDPDVFPAP